MAEQLRYRADNARPWVFAGDPDQLPGADHVIVPFGRIADVAGRATFGVRVEPGQDVRELQPHLDRIGIVELSFPRYRDGRNYSSAQILRRELGYQGEIRAVGDVLVDQLWFMRRCGVDAFDLVEGLTRATAEAALKRYDLVYQPAAHGGRLVWALRHG